MSSLYQWGAHYIVEDPPQFPRAMCAAGSRVNSMEDNMPGKGLDSVFKEIEWTPMPEVGMKLVGNVRYATLGLACVR